MPTRRQLKVAVVGCGAVSQHRHIPSFRRLGKEITLVATCDLDPILAKEVAKKYDIPKSYSSVSEMLVEETPEIVDVCTPPASHKKIAVDSMESGANVLIEKPMALSELDCDKMIEASKKADVKLSIVHNQRFYPPFLRAKKLLEEGKIGRVISVRILSLTPREEYMTNENHWIHKLPGGLIGESGPHGVYLSLPFTGLVSDVYVSPRKLLKYPWVSYDTFDIRLDGQYSTSHLMISHATDITCAEVDFIGTKGMITVDLQNMLINTQARKSLKPISLASSSLAKSAKVAGGVFANAVARVRGNSFLGHDEIVKRFVRSVREGGEVPVTPEEGRQTTRTMEKIVAACKINTKISNQLVQTLAPLTVHRDGSD